MTNRTIAYICYAVAAVTAVLIVGGAWEERAGPLAVFPGGRSYQKIGHIGIVTTVDTTGSVIRPARILHCSSGNWRNRGDAILETGPEVFVNQRDTLYAWPHRVFG